MTTNKRSLENYLEFFSRLKVKFVLHEVTVHAQQSYSACTRGHGFDFLVLDNMLASKDHKFCRGNLTFIKDQNLRCNNCQFVVQLLSSAAYHNNFNISFTIQGYRFYTVLKCNYLKLLFKLLSQISAPSYCKSITVLLVCSSVITISLYSPADHLE